MKPPKIFFMTWMFLLVSFQVRALESGAQRVLTFREALRTAAEKSPTAVMADERVQEALERLNQARSYLFPKITGDVSETRRTENLQTLGFKPAADGPSVVGPFNAFDARVKLTQILFDPATVRRLEAVRAGKELSAAEAKKAKQDVLALVGALYIETRRDIEAVKFAKTALCYAEEKARLADEHFKLGTGSETDLQEAKSELAANRYLVRAAESAETAKRLDLKAALGLSPGDSLKLAGEDPIFQNRLPNTQDIPAAVQSHPEVKVAEENFKGQKAQELVERAGYLPKISGAADYGSSGSQPGRGEATYDLGLELSWPIFEAGEQQAKVAEAESKTRQAKTNFNEVKIQKEAKALEAKDSLKDARLFLVAQGDRRLWKKKELELAKARFQNGTASVLDVIRVSRDAAEAENDAAEASALYRMAQINLAHALGHMEKFLEG